MRAASARKQPRAHHLPRRGGSSAQTLGALGFTAFAISQQGSGGGGGGGGGGSGGGDSDDQIAEARRIMDKYK